MLVTTEDCVSEFGGWVVIDEGLDCTMTADVTVTNTDENESNGALVVTVEGAEGPWSATWYDADGFIVGTGEGIDGLDAGSFSVLVTDSIGCSAEVTDINVLTGLQDIDGMTWAVYPNPAHDVLTLHGLPLGASWALINTQGQTMATGQGLRREVIQVSDVASGMYLLQVTDHNGTTARRVNVQH